MASRSSFLILTALAISPASAQTRQWTTQFGTAGTDHTNGVAVTADAIYAGGETFGTFTGQNNSGKSDAFVSKFDLQGTHLWSRQFGSLENESVLGVAADSTGVYVVGWTRSEVGGTNVGGSDAFIRKYDPNGNLLWARQFGTIRDDQAQAVAADATGAYITGFVTGNLLQPPGTAQSDVFLRKYDPNGTEEYTRQFGGPNGDQGHGIAVDATGVYISGSTGGGMEPGPDNIAVGGTDGFLRKFTLSGGTGWTRTYGSTTSDDFHGIALNSTGIYISGGTTGTITGQSKIGGLWDAVVVKYDLNGVQQWIRQIGSTDDDYGNGVAVAGQWVYAVGRAGSALAVWRLDLSNGSDTGSLILGTFSNEAFGVSVDGTAAYVTGRTIAMQLGPNPIGDADGFLFKIPHPPQVIGVADAFGNQVGIAPSTWVAIYGRNLSRVTQNWDVAISGNQLPTVLQNVSVRINNKPGTVFFVSPGQVNVLAPLDEVVGPVPVILTTESGTSPVFQVNLSSVLPAFYSPFGQPSGLFVTGVALDGTLVGKPGVDPRVTRGARPGEVIQFYATGFGRTNPPAPSDTIFTGAPEVVNRPRITIGGREASIIGNGNLVGPGLYQFNATIPDLADGDHAIIAEIGNVRSPATVFLTVRR